MAQNFKSKDLTISIPEKGDEQIHPTIALAQPTTTVHATTTVTTHTIFTPTCACTFHSCWCSFHTPVTLCTLATHTVFITPGTPVEREISDIKDVETLETLRDKLTSTLKDVEGKLKDAKAK